MIVNKYMKKINNYIVEKLNLNKIIKNDIHEEIPFDEWVDYLSDIGLTYKVFREINTADDWKILLKNTDCPAINIKISKPNKLIFTISSVYLGDEYNGKFNKKEKFTNSWWQGGFDMKEKSYLFTINNANLLKNRIEDIIDSSK